MGCEGGQTAHERGAGRRCRCSLDRDRHPEPGAARGARRLTVERVAVAARHVAAVVPCLRCPPPARSTRPGRHRDDFHHPFPVRLVLQHGLERPFGLFTRAVQLDHLVDEAVSECPLHPCLPSYPFLSVGILEPGGNHSIEGSGSLRPLGLLFRLGLRLRFRLDRLHCADGGADSVDRVGDHRAVPAGGRYTFTPGSPPRHGTRPASSTTTGGRTAPAARKRHPKY